MSEAKEDATEFYPLATNILKLQYYSNYFDLTEIVMFDWFVVKAKAFKYQQFYYSRRRISEEVRIKEDRLTTIIRRFTDIGIIEVDIKGMPKQHYFIVSFEQIIALIPEIFQFAENSKLCAESSNLYAFFRKLLAENSTQKKYNKESNKESISNLRNEKKGVGDTSFSKIFDEDLLKNNNETDKGKKAREAAERKAEKEKEQQAAQKIREIEYLKDLLKITYKNRVNRYNKDVKKGDFVRSHSKIVFSKVDAEALYELRHQPDIDYSDIEGSFAAFVDAFLEGDTGVKKPIPYFLAKKPDTGEFDTFFTYHSLHLLYGYEKQ